MSEKFESSYCSACGKTVKVFALLADGNYLYRCMQCGMEVEPPQKANTKRQEVHSILKDDHPEPSTSKVEPEAEVKASQKSKKLAHIMVAEDSKLLSQLIQDILLQEGYADQVTASLDGDVFIQKFTESMIKKSPPNLIILDINLPAIDGMNICVSIRAIEKAFGLQKGRPILFFSAREVDNHLKKLMETYPPARYINKGNDADPEKLAQRIRKVMETLLKPSTGL